MKLRMLQLLKKVLWMGLLACGWQTACGFSLLGPEANSPEDSFQVVEIGYNPLVFGAAPPYFTDSSLSGPKNLGEGYRLNVPVLYYTFDPSFSWFGANGEAAVQQAFDMMNNAFTNNPTGLTNGLDGYSPDLSEFPLNSESINYTARSWGLTDLKSTTLTLLLEQMGLADSVRYTWALIDRYNPPGSTCPPGGPAVGYQYYVIQRNFDYINNASLTNLEYSAYVNNELYSYTIEENCDAPAASPPAADAFEIPADPLNIGPPVASGIGEYSLLNGSFYTGLTRDDMAGLRYLLSSNNIFAPSAGYLEPSAAGSVAVSGGGGGGNGPPFQLTTSSLSILSFTDPATLQTLFPGLVINSVTTNLVNGQTSYVYTFGNLVTYSSATNTPVQIQVQTTKIAPPIGAPSGSSPVTNITTRTTTLVQSNLLSGDFYIIPTNSCGLTVLGVVATNVTTVTNFLGAVTNAPSNSTVITLTNRIITSTNHVLLVTLCTSAPGTTNSAGVVGDFQGIERVQFVRVSDGNYDYQTGQFYNPLTNQYSMVLMRNGHASTVVFQRVVTRPDILFMGQNLSKGGNDSIFYFNGLTRTMPNWINSRVAANLSGPGISDPTSSGIVFTFNTVGPVYENTSPFFLFGPGGAIARSMIWGSFDGSTNMPVVYPNGTSIANLAAEALIQISPTTLPDATVGASYNVVLSAAGGQSPYAWGLASGSPGLPASLNLSPAGVISGTPAESGTFDFIIQMTDSSVPTPNSVQMDYSITIH
jgi:hypothetical protein